MTDNSTLDRTRKMAAGINSCLNAAKAALEAIAHAQHKERDGTTDAHLTALTRCIEAAKEFDGLTHEKLISEVKATEQTLIAENKAVETLQKAINSGGWLNRDVAAGEFDKYQPESDIDAKSLASALTDCRKLSADLKLGTARGRTSALLGTAVLELRERMKAAVPTVAAGYDSKLWKAVEAVTAVAAPLATGQSLTEFTPTQFLLQNLKQNSSEFAAATREAAYQRQVNAITESLAGALAKAPTFDEPAIEAGLELARQHNVQSKFRAATV